MIPLMASCKLSASLVESMDMPMKPSSELAESMPMKPSSDL